MVVMSYIDDILCLGDTESDCLLTFDTLIDLIERLGLDVNWKKVVNPTQKLVFLGVDIDSVERTFALPESKVREFELMLQQWLPKRRATKVELQRILGKLN
jgi:hypothetical protein